MPAGLLNARAMHSADVSTRASSSMPQHVGLCKLPSLRQFRPAKSAPHAAAPGMRAARRLEVVATYPEPETEKERSPIDYPQVGPPARPLRPPRHRKEWPRRARASCAPASHARAGCAPAQEWITPQPSRRPDIFPEFEKLETPMPKPLPGDPELPDEGEEEEEEKKKKNPDEPEKEEEPKPDEPAPSQE
jgi:hypothetical protein